VIISRFDFSFRHKTHL